MENQRSIEAIKEFAHPSILFSEHVIQPGERLDFQTFNLKASRDMVVDLLAVSEESYSLVGPLVGANETHLHYLGINWHILERPPWLPVGYASMEAFHQFHEADRLGAAFFGSQAATIQAWATLRWRHAVPWVYNPLDALTVDFAAPVVAAGVPFNLLAQPLDVVFDASSRKSKAQRSYIINAVMNAQQFVNIPMQSLTAHTPQTSVNFNDEPVDVRMIGVNWTERAAGAGNYPNEARLLNHLRMRVTPSIGRSWSETPVPLAFYGSHLSMPSRVAWHRPEGGPIFLEAGQAVAFDFINYRTAQGQATNIQAALIGRIADGD